MGETSIESLSFEQALAELDQVVRDLEDGQTGLEAALARYEAGVRLLKHCYQQLAHAEQRILLLTAADSDGEPSLRPFEHTATVAIEKVEVRRRKKGDDPEKLF